MYTVMHSLSLCLLYQLVSKAGHSRCLLVEVNIARGLGTRGLKTPTLYVGVVCLQNNLEEFQISMINICRYVIYCVVRVTDYTTSKGTMIYKFINSQL